MSFQLSPLKKRKKRKKNIFTDRTPSWPFRLDDLPEVDYGSPQFQRVAQHPTKQFLQGSFIQRLLRYFPRLDPWSRRHFNFQRRLTDGEPWHSALTAGYAGRREDERGRLRPCVGRQVTKKDQKVLAEVPNRPLLPRVFFSHATYGNTS